MDHLIIERTKDTVTTRTVLHPNDSSLVGYLPDTLERLAPHLGRAAFNWDHGVDMGKANERLLASANFDELTAAHEEHDRLWALQEEYAQEAIRKLQKEESCRHEES